MARRVEHEDRVVADALDQQPEQLVAHLAPAHLRDEPIGQPLLGLNAAIEPVLRRLRTAAERGGRFGGWVSACWSRNLA